MILVTHWHGDHVGGIIGLLQTISDKDNPPKIEIYGPSGTKKRVQHLLDSVVFDGNNLDLKVYELTPKKVETFKEKDDFYLQCAPMDHTTPCIGYSFVEKDVRKVNLIKAKKLGLKEGPVLGKLQRGQKVVVNGKTILPDDVSSIKKGRKISFVFDTVPNKNAYELAKEADLLITEAVYLPDMKDNAAKYKHLTTEDSGLIANNANVKKLIITHFSQRYKDASVLEDDIKNYFANSKASYDFMKVKI